MLELASPATRSFSDPLARWCERNIRLDGVPFSFDGHEYLRAIYDDTAPHVVLSKAAQIGGTTWSILRSIHACAMGLNVVYYFPTRTDVIDFSKSRVGPLLADNPLLAKLMRDTDTAGLKKIGDAHLYLRGMQSTVGMKSVPADMIVFDELDEATPEAKALARERLAHSDYKRGVDIMVRANSIKDATLVRFALRMADVVIEPDVKQVHWADFGAVDRCIEAGDSAAAQAVPRIRDLLARCLRKDPTQRLREIGSARLDVEDAMAEISGGGSVAPAPARKPLWQR